MMHWGNHMGFGSWGWVLIGGLWIGLIVLGVLILARLFPTGGSDNSAGPATGRRDAEADDPLAIVRRRYARGELTKEEYETMRHDLAPD